MLVCVQASGYSSLEDSFDHDVSRQGSVHLEDASVEGEKTGGLPFLLPFSLPVSQSADCLFVAFQGRPARAPTSRVASRTPAAVPERNHSLTRCSICDMIIITPSSVSAPLWIWGVSPFLLDLQDTSLFFYFNMLL